MSSRLITPPDLILENDPCVIINAVDSQVDTLYLYLKTSSDKRDIHLYHSGMPDTDWLLHLIDNVNTVLVNRDLVQLHSHTVQNSLANLTHLVWFGLNEDYKDPSDYFLNQNKLQN